MERLAVLLVVIYSFLQVSSVLSASIEERCKALIPPADSGYCYDKDSARLCASVCRGYMSKNEDCAFGNGKNARYNCDKEITKDTCNEKCDDKIANEKGKAIGINCCGTCLTVCGKTPARIVNRKSEYKFLD